MKTTLLAMALATVVIACAGDAGPPEPLITANVSGSAGGTNFAPMFGVSAVLDSGTVATVIGTGELNCGSVTSISPPPAGHYVSVQIPEATVGIATTQFFRFILSEGGSTSGGGSGAGTVDVTAVSDTTIAMIVSYAATINGVDYALDGDFEAVRCP